MEIIWKYWCAREIKWKHKQKNNEKKYEKKFAFNIIISCVIFLFRMKINI